MRLRTWDKDAIRLCCEEYLAQAHPIPTTFHLCPPHITMTLYFYVQWEPIMRPNFFLVGTWYNQLSQKQPSHASALIRIVLILLFLNRNRAYKRQGSQTHCYLIPAPVIFLLVHPTAMHINMQTVNTRLMYAVFFYLVLLTSLANVCTSSLFKWQWRYKKWLRNQDYTYASLACVCYKPM